MRYYLLGAALAMLVVGCGQSLHPQIVEVPVPGPSGAPGISPSPIPGPQGAAGPKGDPGVNATPTTPIQLCGACHGAYPNVFPESGLCINNQLYGVYSANGGFLSLLPPGTYSSDGINCSCTFTIQANCVVGS
jgi:hypothetical protein